MDSRQAKEILAMYRPGTDDATDPVFAEALALTKTDAELKRWFEQQCALDTVVRAKFKQIHVPSGLSARILAEHKIIRPIVWWKRPAWVAAAAALFLALAATAFVLWPKPSTPLDAYRQKMVEIVTVDYRKTVDSHDFEQLRSLFAAKNWPTDYIVPERLKSVSLAGGGMLTWQGHKVSMLCFDQADKKGLWLFVVDLAVVPVDPCVFKPTQFARVSPLTTVTWISGNKLYMLAGEGDRAFLQQFL